MAYPWYGSTGRPGPVTEFGGPSADGGFIIPLSNRLLKECLPFRNPIIVFVISLSLKHDTADKIIWAIAIQNLTMAPSEPRLYVLQAAGHGRFAKGATHAV